MSDYIKLTNNIIKRCSDNVCFPEHEDNSDYQQYLEWLILGNEPVRMDITWDEIRQKRDMLLQNSDWALMIDVQMDESVLNDWKEYRQILRNIPKQFTSPEDVIWPESPNSN